MDTPDNYYAILGVPLDADSDTLKRAYRQLARRYHPDLAGPSGALEMKRINRAYDVLSDPEKRLHYDTIIGGTLDTRRGGLVRPRPVARKFDPQDNIEFAGLSIFSTHGPLRTGARIRSKLGVISALTSVETSTGLLIAAGSLDSQGMCWCMTGDQAQAARPFPEPVHFAMSQGQGQTVESLRELRFSPGGHFLVGWGRLNLHVWHAGDGKLLWSYPLDQRAVSAHYSLDVVLRETHPDAVEIWLALPLQLKDPLAPRVHGVRGTDVVVHMPGDAPQHLSEPLSCVESEIEKRQFWAIRLRALAPDLRTLFTLSCANVPDETEQLIVLRRWDLTSKSRFGNKVRPQISTAILADLCSRCAPPYAITPDAGMVAFVHAGNTLRLYDTSNGTYSELAGGSMGASSHLALAPDGSWLAVAREDSEVNEGVVDLWSIAQGQIVQKLYHPWQISALHFAGRQLIVALTDGTIQVWKE